MLRLFLKSYDPERFYHLLTSTLKKLGKSQKWLAEQLGVSPKTVNNWAKGRIEIPSHYRGNLTELLGVDILAPHGNPEGFSSMIEKVEGAVAELALRGIKPKTSEQSLVLRKMIGRVLESGSAQGSVADQVQEWIRAAEAFRK